MTASQDNATFDDSGSDPDDILNLCRRYMLSHKNKNVTDVSSNDVNGGFDDEKAAFQVPPDCEEFSSMFNALNMVSC
jgi:hypothetical protein